MFKKILLFSAFSAVFNAVAGSACDIQNQFLMGAPSAELAQIISRKSQPILNAVTAFRAQSLDNKFYGRYIPWFVSQSNFEAKELIFVKSASSDDVAIKAVNSAYYISQGVDGYLQRRSAGRESLFIDIGDDLITLDGVKSDRAPVSPSVAKLRNPDQGEANEAASFYCVKKSPHFIGGGENYAVNSVEFTVPFSVWTHFYAEGGKLNYGVSFKSLRYPVGI